MDEEVPHGAVGDVSSSAELGEARRTFVDSPDDLPLVRDENDRVARGRLALVVGFEPTLEVDWLSATTCVHLGIPHEVTRCVRVKLGHTPSADSSR